MATGISHFSFAAAALYVLVAMAAAAAASIATGRRQPVWNRNVWAALAVLFTGLVVLRFLGTEEILREALREGLRSDGSYAGRRWVQGVIASIAIAVVALAGFAIVRRLSRSLKGRRNIATSAALVAGAAMVFLVVLRLISLHMIDAALYGPLKLNWIIDLGSSLVVAAGAIYYIRIVRARP